MFTLIPIALLGAMGGSEPMAQAGELIQREYVSGSAAMRYWLYIPSTYDGSRPAPLILMLHGCTQDAADFGAGTRMNELAEEEGFLVAYPEQLTSAHPQRCWRWYEPDRLLGEGGEAALMLGLTREVAGKYSVDSRRIFVAGISAGGAMAAFLAASAPELYSGVGVHSGIAYRLAEGLDDALRLMREGTGEARGVIAELRHNFQAAGRAVPLIVFHGGSDAVVNPLNAELLVAQWLGAAGRSFVAPQETTGESGELSWRRRRWREPDAETPWLEYWFVPGLGHAWSGGSATGTYTDPRGPDASRAMIRFFLEPSAGAKPR